MMDRGRSPPAMDPRSENDLAEVSSSSDEEKEVERALADVPFEELQRARADGSHSGRIKPATHQKLARANKNRPMEMSSKTRVGRFRDVIQAPKKVVRDPRFESLSGALDTDGSDERETDREKLCFIAINGSKLTFSISSLPPTSLPAPSPALSPRPRPRRLHLHWIRLHHPPRHQLRSLLQARPRLLFIFSTLQAHDLSSSDPSLHDLSTVFIELLSLPAPFRAPDPTTSIESNKMHQNRCTAHAFSRTFLSPPSMLKLEEKSMAPESHQSNSVQRASFSAVSLAQLEDASSYHHTQLHHAEAMTSSTANPSIAQQHPNHGYPKTKRGSESKPSSITRRQRQLQYKSKNLIREARDLVSCS